MMFDCDHELRRLEPDLKLVDYNKSKWEYFKQHLLV